MTRTVEEIRAEIAALEADLQAAEKACAKMEQADGAKHAITLLTAMRAAFNEIEAKFPGTFDEKKWAVAHNAQAWPRIGKFRRLADLSETEVALAQDAGIEAVTKL